MTNAERDYHRTIDAYALALRCRTVDVAWNVAYRAARAAQVAQFARDTAGFSVEEAAAIAAHERHASAS